MFYLVCHGNIELIWFIVYNFSQKPINKISTRMATDCALFLLI